MNKDLEIFNGRLKVWNSFHQFFEDLPNLKALTMIVKNDPYSWYAVGAIFSVSDNKTVSFQKLYFNQDELQTLGVTEKTDEDIKKTTQRIDERNGFENVWWLENLHTPLKEASAEVLNVMALESNPRDGIPFRMLTIDCFNNPLNYDDVLMSFFGSSVDSFKKVATEKKLRAAITTNPHAVVRRI